ncbi:MAG: hypothetical protein ACPGXL_08310 [Chitinophagales bacterium]
MQVTLEISLYPLQAEYEASILAFLNRMQKHRGFLLKTNSTSTQIFGDYDAIMQALTKEIKVSFQEEGARIFVMKIMNIDLSESAYF